MSKWAAKQPSSWRQSLSMDCPATNPISSRKVTSGNRKNEQRNETLSCLGHWAFPFPVFPFSWPSSINTCRAAGRGWANGAWTQTHLYLYLLLAALFRNYEHNAKCQGIRTRTGTASVLLINRPALRPAWKSDAGAFPLFQLNLHLFMANRRMLFSPKNTNIIFRMRFSRSSGLIASLAACLAAWLDIRSVGSGSCSAG